LDYVSGESPDRRLRRLAAEGKRQGHEEAAAITADIAEAVDYAHGQGLIHRDIKPANVMITERGQAVLMDFGVAKIIGGTQQTATGMLVGTAFYISPERVRDRLPSVRSDIYALGVSLFEMLAGRPPYTWDSAMSVMLEHISEPIPDLGWIGPDTPPYLVAVVEKAMARDPRERLASAREMAAALRQTGASASGGPATIMERTSGPSALSATLVDSDAAAGPAARSSPPLSGAPRAAPSGVRPATTAGPAQLSAPPLAALPLAAPPLAARSAPAASGVRPAPAKLGGRAWV
jgi:serine/threonine-protein kinase